ncbi:MAG: hypothetical protein EON98_04265 [Chitinophagaceae bacterium]|nr:MAG: hypothetical protein EON98_04265 [Chitinophagaceae bacterium]
MKKVLILVLSIGLLQACSNNGGQTGVQNDGIKSVDTNGGLADTTYKGDQSATDTSKMENRVDLSKRDTFEKPSQHP